MLYLPLGYMLLKLLCYELASYNDRYIEAVYVQHASTSSSRGSLCKEILDE
jgi:hypothetical protein